MAEGGELTMFLRQMERSVAYLKGVRGQHARVALRWAEHLDGDRRSLWLLALVLEGEAGDGVTLDA